MRELKLRAWDKRKQRYSDIFDIWSIDMDGSARTHLPGLGKSYEEDTIIEQYIGQKDINGKDIYEGDLLQTSTEIKKVVFNPTCLTFALQGLKGGATTGIGIVDYIVGNIHEGVKDA